MATATVTPEQRYSRFHPCPICGGWDSLTRHKSVRCNGMRHLDGLYASCKQQQSDHPGSLGTWVHILSGPCNCGEHHDGQPALHLVDQALHKRDAAPAKVHAALPDRSKDGLPFDEDYIYHDADGVECYRKRKYSDGVPHGARDYLQCHRTPEGWLYNLEGCERVLYCLPELLTSDPARPVHFTEGEKDARRLASLGLVATTYSDTLPDLSPLAGRIVVLHADNDPAGEAKIAKNAAALEGIARDVRVIRYQDMPTKSDVSDWLDAGHNPLDLIGRDEAVSPLCSSANAAPADLEAAKATIASQNQKLQFIRELASVPQTKLSPLDKWNLLQNAWEVEWKPEPDEPRRPDGTVPVRTEGAGGKAEKLGASKDAVNSSDVRLEKAGLIHIVRYREATLAGSITRKAIKLQPGWQSLKRRDLPEREKQHGGVRYTCKSCGSEQVTVTLTCTVCGCKEVLKDFHPPLGQQDATPETILYRGQQDATPAPNDRVNTYAKRVASYKAQGLDGVEAVRRVERENRLWWELHPQEAVV